MHDKQGNYLTFKEYISRWKEGIEGISPKQKIISQIWGTRISLLGIVLGLIVSIIGIKRLWWIALILLGALIVTGTQYIGLIQQRNLFEDIEKQIGGQNEQ